MRISDWSSDVCSSDLVTTDFLEGPLLTVEFTGGGGASGEAAMRGVLKPAGFGTMENIEPVWFDTTRWIGCIDGYGNTTATTTLMEGLADRGAAVANYASRSEGSTDGEDCVSTGRARWEQSQ